MELKISHQDSQSLSHSTLECLWASRPPSKPSHQDTVCFFSSQPYHRSPCIWHHSNKGKGSLLEEPCRYLGWQPCLLVDWYSHIFTTSGTIGHTSGVLRQSDWHVQEKTSSMGLLLGCAWNGVSMGSMCWAAATISKQCSVLCFVMAVFISQQAWLEERTRAMQQLHLQNDLAYQVCSQQFKNRKKSVVCYTRSAFGGAFLEDSTRLMCGESASCMLGMSHISGLSQFEWLQLLNAISWHMASVLATKLFGQNWFLKPGL